MFGEIISKEEVVDEVVSKEEGINPINLEKEWDPFVEYDFFFSKTVFRLMSLLREVSLLDTMIFLGANERADGNSQDCDVFGEDGVL